MHELRIKNGICIFLSCVFLSLTAGCQQAQKSPSSRSFNSYVQQDLKSDCSLETNTTDGVNFCDLYKLPPLDRMVEEDRSKLVGSLQIMKKIKSLNFDVNTAMYPEKNWKSLYSSILSKVNSLNADQEVSFQGKKASELNQLLKSSAGKMIQIQSREILLDEPIVLQSNTCLIGNNAKIVKSAELGKALLICNVKNAMVDGLNFENKSDYGIYVINSSNVLIAHNTLSQFGKKPLTVMGQNDYINIISNKITNNGEGGIYCDGKISDCLIEGNLVQGNKGTSNWMAGIVLSGTAIGDLQNPYKDFGTDNHFPKAQQIQTMLDCPNSVIVRDNTIENNNASGIYSDGAYNCYILTNQIIGNDKEGICLDYGSFAAYVKDNLFEKNGRRINQTDRDLENDFVLSFGRMQDGSAKSKLPGISLDNTAYNIIVDNHFLQNYGSGVKMVRTGVCNLIMNNNIESNNFGENNNFHFFGIELGFAGGDTSSDSIDFTADFENIICRNMITGPHYSGIFLAEECYVNDMFDNTILNCEHFSMECLSNKYNSSLNNYSDRPSRGIWLSDKNGAIIVLPRKSD
jgi:parallel beta-helix repeat protein